jgi:hypothetical protein
MRHFSLNHALVLLSVTTLFCGHTLAQNLLDDGSFNLATGGGAVSNSAWVLTVDFPDPNNPTDGSAQFQGGFANAENGSGGPGDGGNGIWFKSFLGVRGGNTSIPTANASITQSIVAPISGNYILNFVAGREQNFTAGQFSVSLSSSGTGGSSSVDLLTAPMTLGNIGGAASPALGGNPFSLTLMGVTAGDTLTVTGAMVDGRDFNMPGGQSAFLDAFVLVPEPASAALLLGPVILLRRSRR